MEQMQYSADTAYTAPLFSFNNKNKMIFLAFFCSYMKKKCQIWDRIKNTQSIITMEDYKKTGMGENEKEIVFSQAIKAGKRIYYIDVKKNRKEEMYISITESKKIVSGEGDDATVTFEKHKIFLYKEDFEKFATSLKEAIGFITENQGEFQPRYNSYDSHAGEEKAAGSTENEFGNDFKIDIDF